MSATNQKMASPHGLEPSEKVTMLVLVFTAVSTSSMLHSASTAKPPMSSMGLSVVNIFIASLAVRRTRATHRFDG